MRPWWLPSLLLPLCAAAAVPVQLSIDNQAKLPEAQVQAMRDEYAAWAQRVYAYLHVNAPAPVHIALTRDAHVGMYVDDTLYMPPDEHDEMLETFIHELAHQATGHESSFFFKEGIATHTLEALYAQDGKIPQGWPQYGEPCDAWVALFAARHQLLSLREALYWAHFDGHDADGDYRSWQIYLMGASFARWFIGAYGYDAYKKMFDTQQLPAAAEKLEHRWLAAVAAEKFAPFDPAHELPRGERYQGYARRLRGG
ncbi:MAG TPA: hypothetical protein VHE37_16365 [Nevskiaceae bacterium]|nr:hypothetical protein [Nevskiaceae bacterium]